VSTDQQQPPSPTPPPFQPFDPAAVPQWILPMRPKFQHRYTTHIVLFLLTLLTTSFVQAFQVLWFYQVSQPWRFFNLEVFTQGLWYSLPVLTILGAHEFGHYFLCRRHDVDATLPYFLPAPLPLSGTLGAVIRIKQAFPSKRALFDIGVAGPIAGFVALVPFLYYGLKMSTLVNVADLKGSLSLGEPLLLKFFARIIFGTLPQGQDIAMHPMGMAAWWGMLATALNLMPFGQLDGGHIVYSLLGRPSWWVSAATLVAAVLLTSQSASWISMTIMMMVMAVLLGLRHPRIVDEETPLDGRRRLIAFFALVIFILCFTPVPLDVFLGN
jgi:membrane-associated protease RseP (regulator of RpoE activity)